MYLNKWQICRKRICLKAVNNLGRGNRIIRLCLIIYSNILRNVAEDVLLFLNTAH